MTIQGMADGTCSERVYLASLDCGTGKSQATAHATRTLVEDPAYRQVGVVVCVGRLSEVGDWMKKYSGSVYGTTASPFPKPLSWGRVTQKPGKIYVHLLDSPDPLLALSGLPKVTRAKVLASGSAVEVTQVAGGIVLRLPDQRDPSDTVIVLDTAR